MASKAKRMSKTEFIEAVQPRAGWKEAGQRRPGGLTGVIYKELKAQNEVVIPGLVKLTAVTKPAVPEHEGINPFTKEKTMFKAKPAAHGDKASSRSRHSRMPSDILKQRP